MSNIEEGRTENFIKAYEEIKAQSFIIESINKDFFFEFADCLIVRIKELEENKKYIVQLTDEKYKNLVDIIKKEVKQEFEQKVKDGIEELKLSGGSNGKDDIENLARELIIDVLEKLLEVK